MRKPAPNARKPLQHEAVDDRAHAVLADAEVQVAPAVARRPRRSPPPLISVSVEGARSAEPPTSSGTCAAAHWITSWEALRVAIMPGVRALLRDVGVPALGQLAREHALELGRLGRVLAAVGLEALAPLGLELARRASTQSRKCSSASSGTKNGSWLGQP